VVRMQRSFEDEMRMKPLFARTGTGWSRPSICPSFGFSKPKQKGKGEKYIYFQHLLLTPFLWIQWNPNLRNVQRRKHRPLRSEPTHRYRRGTTTTLHQHNFTLKKDKQDGKSLQSQAAPHHIRLRQLELYYECDSSCLAATGVFIGPTYDSGVK
jgi:hypothetical protein